MEAGDLLTIDEILARAQLEPALFDIYVEGRGDAALFQMLFEHLGIEVGVFPVKDRLDIRREEVLPYSEDYGNRGMLIAAASRVHEELGSDQSSLLFVVDADWAHAIGPMPILNSCLEMTDKPSMEHYFLSSGPFGRFLALGLQLPDVDQNEVKGKLGGALQDVAVARIVLNTFGIACFDKAINLCDFSSAITSADTGQIIKRSVEKLPKNGQPDTWQNLAKFASGYKEMIKAANHPGRGHDIAPALIKILGLKGHFADVDIVESLMRTSVTSNDLLEQVFFQRIVERVSA